MFSFVIRRRKVRRHKIHAAKRAHYALHKDAARHAIIARVAELNAHYGFTHSRISIRSQRSRWGSCSKKGNLNFNYAIASLPPALMDYVIVHELCHLSVFNHSPQFWALVKQTVPDYHALRAQLRTHGHLLR